MFLRILPDVRKDNSDTINDGKKAHLNLLFVYWICG